MLIILPTEGNVLPIETQEPMIANGNAMCVSGQVVQHMFGAAKRWLSVDNPLLALQRSRKLTHLCSREVTHPQNRIENAL